MDERSIQLFEEALKDGKEIVYHIRVMVVGHLGVGKTTLIKRLLREEVNISERHSTEGIDVYINCCDASLSTLEWTRQKQNSELDDRLHRVVRVLNEQQSARSKVDDNDQLVSLSEEETPDSIASVTDEEQDIFTDQGETTDSNASVTYEEQVIINHQEEITCISASVTVEDQVIITHQDDITDISAIVTANEQVITAHQDKTTDTNSSVTANDQVLVPPEGVKALKSNEGAHTDFEDKDTELLYHRSPRQDQSPNLSATSSQLEELPSAILQNKLTQSEANALPVLKLLHENANKLKQDTNAKAKLTIWDFAGQYAFYTTHQAFLTQRAIYLLVSDVSEQVTDVVADDCYFDSRGIKRCKVHELTEVWLNSIHSCAPSPKASTPPVILVGTHVDKLTQKQLSAKLVNLERQSTLLSTSTNAASATDEDPMTVTLFGSQQDSLEPPSKQPRLEVTTDASMTGVRAILSEDQLKQQRMVRLLPRSAGPSTEKPAGDIIVGADAGKVTRDEICKGFFRDIRSYLKDKPTRFHLVDEDFAIDNTVVDERLEDLKRKIIEVASQQPYWGEEIPARWILLEQELMNQKAAGVKVISHKEVEHLNKKGTVRIDKSEELELFLRYLHETGIIIYFSIEVLRDNIVLDPIWLIDALKSLIKAHPKLPENPANNGSQSTSPADNGSQSTSPADTGSQTTSPAERTVTQRWSDFKEKGILHLELIDAVWTQEKHPELHAHKDHILLIMEQLNIIAKPRSFSEIGEKVENYFLTPCMLQQETPKEVISPRRNPRMESTPILKCVFRGNFLPSPIFHRLLAACVAHWPVAKKKETSENLIFCGCCVFDLDLFHRLTLYFKNHVISARITRMANDEVKIPDSKLCSKVRRFITLNLSKITSYLGQNLQYDLHVKCPPFEMWNADEGHDPDSPITPEHMNHARLCVALVSVCGKALRDILNKQVPKTHKDIYKAILAEKAKLTCGIRDKSGKWHKALLNQSQSQLVFPDPQQQKTGTLDQFDLSLLYILIRNVSTVSSPVTDWGNDPHDQPRDASLGASVERIRSYRNHISGHSPDGKHSRQELEDYLNKFESVLRDIEAVIGSQGYIPELEKQRRQVISIYEAC